MTKLVQNDIASLTNEQSALAALNSNYASLEAFSDSVLSRDGVTPNEMLADLDMNGNQILNLSAPASGTEPVRLQDLNTIIGGGTIIAGIGKPSPATSADNAVVRWDGTNAASVQNSGVIIDDSNNISGLNNITGAGYVEVPEISAPSSPAADKARIYAKDVSGTTGVFMKDSAGTETKLNQATFWLRDGTGKAVVTNLLNQTNSADSNGTLNVDSITPGTVPANAQALILTIEVGYSTAPAGTQICQIRVMPSGYNLGAVLDRAKLQQVFPTGNIDVTAMHVLMPIAPGKRDFFWARQSTDNAVANKMSIIDLWGYVI
jgi:hypothetical protein